MKTLIKRYTPITFVLSLFMICVFFMQPNTAMANVGDVGGHGSGDNSGGNLTNIGTYWGFSDFGDANNTDAVINSFLSHYKSNKNVSWSSKSMSPRGKNDDALEEMRKAIEGAVKDCTNDVNNKGCKNPRLVGLGAQMVYYNGAWIPNSSSEKHISSIPDSIKNNTIKVNGNNVTLEQVLNNGGKSIYITAKDLADENEHNFIAVVIGEAQYSDQKGWYPVFSNHKLADVASSNQLKTTQLEACPVDYSVSANGVDGYVKGKAVATQVYHTPYGYLYDAVAKGSTWKAADGTVYGPFKGDWKNQTSMVDKVKEARNKACDETYNMSLDYDLGSGKTVTVSGSAVPNEDTNGDGKVDSNDFLTQYSKGGIYKIIKQEKKASITVKESEPVYYKRESYYIVFRGWATCEKGQDITFGMLYPGSNQSIPGVDDSKLPGAEWNKNKCGHISEPKPSTPPNVGITWNNSDPRGFVSDSVVDDNGKATNKKTSVGIWWQGPSEIGYDSVNAWQLTTRTNKNGVNEVKDAVLGTGLKTDNYGHWISWDDISKQSGETRRVSGVFSLGVPTLYKCADGQTIKGLETDLSAKDLASQNCTPVKWTYSNRHLAWNTKNNGIKWFNKYSKDIFESGSENPAILNDRLVPVANNMQSYHTIMVQDFMHVNCNKNDLDKYVDKVRDKYGENVVQSVTSEKLSGEIVSKPQYPDAAGNVIEPFGRALTVLGDGNAATGYAVSNPGSTGFSAINYTTNYYNTSNGTIRDPFYTKECPFDCVDTSTTTSGNAINNVRDANVDGNAKASRNYGVKVRAADEKGNLPSDSTNTAIMTFFKNNAKNAFTVDVWHPVETQGSVTWNGAKAISTTILSNVDTTGKNDSDDVTRNGTPWVINNKVLTNMSAGSKQLFNVSTDNVGTNLSRLTAANNVGAHQMTLSGQVNEFTIKSPWASEAGKPLRFNIKWEYEASNKVMVPAKFTIKANGLHVNHTADTVNYDTVAIDAKVDGQCYSNALNTGETNTQNAFHDNTGYGSRNDLDTGYHEGGSVQYPFGYFEVNFVRATAE